MIWETVGTDILGASTKVNLRDGCRILHYRIDGRNNRLRLDVKTMAVLPWEAIDNGEDFKNIEAARLWAREHATQCSRQNTLSPRMPER